MFNYNHEVFLSIREEETTHREAAQRQVPYHLRNNPLANARLWLSTRAFWPVIDGTVRISKAAGYRGGRYWRRAYTRAFGLLVNTFAYLRELMPTRPSMA